MASRKFNAKKYQVKRLSRRDELSSKRPKSAPVVKAPVVKAPTPKLRADSTKTRR